jgi:tRNA (cmo5U34)-methyltransferase
MAIDQAFNDTIAYYDNWIRKAVPGYDDMFAIAVELLPFAPDAAIDVLDLGAGTGLFSSLVREKCPRGRFVLFDVAEKMLDVARERFRPWPDQFRYVVDDYRNLGEGERYDLVISSLSIHHLADDEKEALYARVYALLREGGLFINVDQIKGPTPTLQERYCSAWLEKVRKAGASEEEIQAGQERRLAYDREATLADQLRWLQAAGFVDVDCIYKNYLMGLLYAVKPAV